MFNSPYPTSPSVGSHNELVDPDPFVLAGICLTSVGTILQLVQTYKLLKPSPPSSKPSNISRSQLTHLEDSIESLQRELRKATRAVEHNLKDSDQEFYDAPLRISSTSLLLPKGGFDEFNEGASNAAGQMSGIIRWISHIIGNNPALAYRLGERMAGSLEQTADVLNRALQNGSPTRIAISETRSTLQVLAKAIEAELAERSN